MKQVLLLLYLAFFSDNYFLLAQELTKPGCAPHNTPSEKKAEGIVSEWETAHPASFPGGGVAFATFIRNNLCYPEAAKKAGISVDIIISFIVEKDGSLTNIDICRDIGYGCGEEAVRLAQKMPKWIPGRVNGNDCRIWMNLLIPFRLPKKR